MALVVLLELREPADALVAQATGAPPQRFGVRLVHAAAPDRDRPGAPGPVTVCGRDTALMLVDPWKPAGPRWRWWPPQWAGRLCPPCDRGARGSARPPGVILWPSGAPS